MRYLVLGAGGIIGQHMMLQRPEELFVRRTESVGYIGADCSYRSELFELLNAYQPEVVINLAGENRVDHVDNGAFDDPVYRVNVGTAAWAAEWCANADRYMIQVSTQGVFSGNNPPYAPLDTPHPITSYGHHKAQAENLAYKFGATIARVTFVLGVRPFDIGRVNPLEQMFASSEQRQVNDRFFSVAFAKDVANYLWTMADLGAPGLIHHLGIPESTCRYEIAKAANPLADITPVSDDDFPGARRPLDTTWAKGALYKMDFDEGLADAQKDWMNLHG